MKEIEVTIRLRNNRLKQRRLDLGLSQSQLAKRVGISAYAIMGFETLKCGPYDKSTGEIRSNAQRLLDFFCCSVEDLWPVGVLKIEKSNAIARLDTEEAARLLGSERNLLLPSPEDQYDYVERSNALDKILSTLNSREAAIIRDRFGLNSDGREKSLDALAKEQNVTRSRIMQIESKALSILRHPTRTRHLKQFTDMRLQDDPERT